jgi:MEMO1 family protein
LSSERRSPFAGSWYPADPRELEAMVARFVAEEEEVELEGELVALISPHAGLVYSGPVAGAGYRLLARDAPAFATAVLLGPSHRKFFDALAVYPAGAFATPLGPVPIDAELADAFLRETPRARAMPEVHGDEHCLEMQLPFLRYLLPDLRIVPVLMGNQSVENVAAAARAVAAVAKTADRPVLLVASSDLSHYESRARARELDDEVLGCVGRFDAPALASLFERNSRHACGGGPIVAVMAAARALGATEASVLRYGDSGDVSGDTDAVVGYVSAALYRKG